MIVKPCAIRGRPTSGGTRQHLEIRNDVNANAITTVSKDSMVLIVDDIYNNRPSRVYDKYSPTIRSERTGLKILWQNH